MRVDRYERWRFVARGISRRDFVRFEIGAGVEFNALGGQHSLI